MPGLADRVILITGASRGLGAALAEACAGEGARLILLARTRGALEEVDDRLRSLGAEPTLIALDLAELDSVDRLGPSIYQRFGRLDGLAACAAELGTLTPAPHIDPKAFQRVLTVNLLANQRLIRTVDPLLRASDAGWAVFVTDRTASRGRAFWGAYGASKAALEAVALAWAAETSRVTRLRVNLVDPGPMRTRLRAQAFPGEDSALLPAPGERAPAVVSLLRPDSSEGGELIRLA